jgi:hypothetical protein
MRFARLSTSLEIWGSAVRPSTTGGAKTASIGGIEPGLSSGEHAELLAAKRRIAQLENELKIAR